MYRVTFNGATSVVVVAPSPVEAEMWANTQIRHGGRQVKDVDVSVRPL